MKTLTFTDKSPYGITSGNFALAWIDKKKGTVENRLSEDDELAIKYSFQRSCLEEFNNFFRDEDKSIIHCHNANFAQYGDLTYKISEFMNLIDTHLGLDKKTEIFRVNENTKNGYSITPIRVPDFHLQNKMRRWVFTLLARDGKQYDSAIGLDSVLENNGCYVKPIKTFVRVYLSGFTVFSKNCLDKVYANMKSGPINQFSNLTEDDIKGKLLLEEEE